MRHPSNQQITFVGLSNVGFLKTFRQHPYILRPPEGLYPYLIWNSSSWCIPLIYFSFNACCPLVKFAFFLRHFQQNKSWHLWMLSGYMFKLWNHLERILVGGLEHVFPYIGNNNPNWLIYVKIGNTNIFPYHNPNWRSPSFFRGVGGSTTNQSWKELKTKNTRSDAFQHKVMAKLT